MKKKILIISVLSLLFVSANAQTLKCVNDTIIRVSCSSTAGSSGVEVLDNDIIPCGNPVVQVLSSSLYDTYVRSDGSITFALSHLGLGEYKDSIQYEVTCGTEKDTAWFYLIKIEDEHPVIQTLKAVNNEIYIEVENALTGGFYSIASEDGTFYDYQSTGRNNPIKSATFSGSFSGKYHVQVCRGECCVYDSITITEFSGVSNVKASFSCPGQVTVTYDLGTADTTDVTLYYSPDGGKTWLIAQTVSGDLTEQTAGSGKTITWNNRADNVNWGKFKLKVDVPETPEQEPECVMIDGVCWATRNVGAPGTFVQNPEDPGMFYRWNSKIGWSTTLPLVSTDGSAWINSWNGNGSTTWEKENDPCPDGWRVPTYDEWGKLVNSPIRQWQTIPAIGRLIGNGSNTIFLPVTGEASFGSLQLIQEGSYGMHSLIARYRFDSTGGYWSSAPLYYGLCIRCVKE